MTGGTGSESLETLDVSSATDAAAGDECLRVNLRFLGCSASEPVQQ